MPESAPHAGNSSLEAKKQEAYERLCEGVPDALYILGHDIVKNEATGEFKSGSYANRDTHGRVGGAKARSIAGAELHKFLPHMTVIASVRLKGEPYSHARITSKELQKRGVSEDHIILQENPDTTFTELIELIKLIVQHDWHHAAVLANEFQIPRARAMLEHIDTLHDPQGYSEQPESQEALSKFKQMQPMHITFVSAEEVLPLINPRYKKVIDDAKQSPAWEETVQKELEGARQVRAGEYWGNKRNS